MNQTNAKFTILLCAYLNTWIGRRFGGIWHKLSIIARNLTLNVAPNNARLYCSGHTIRCFNQYNLCTARTRKYCKKKTRAKIFSKPTFWGDFWWCIHNLVDLWLNCLAFLLSSGFYPSAPSPAIPRLWCILHLSTKPLALFRFK